MENAGKIKEEAPQKVKERDPNTKVQSVGKDEGSPRLFWVDFIRGLSIVLVVFIHVSSQVMGQWGDIKVRDWWAGDIYDSLARVCVPLLFMVSGYLLLCRDEGIADFYRKRFIKVVIPFLVWSVFYLIWREGFAGYTFINAIKAIILGILIKPAMYHLWFMYELLAVYLFVPVLRIFVRSANPAHLWYFAALWFLAGPVLDLVEQFILHFEVGINLGFFTGYIGYFFLGYLLGQFPFSRIWTWLSVVVYLAASAVVAYGTYFVISNATGQDEFYLNYLRMPVVLASISAFIFLKSLGEWMERKGWQGLLKIGRWFAQASFGVYLIHVLIIFYLRRGIYFPEIHALSGPAAVMIPVTALCVILISWLIVAIMQRIPIVRFLVPK